MEPISTFLTVALGYIIKGAAQSSAAKSAKEELLGSFWQWIRPRFIKDVPDIETNPDTAGTQGGIEEKLMGLIQDENFFNELVNRVNELQQEGIREKNIVFKDIKRVRKIRIGDREYHPNKPFDRMNIVEGNIEDADEFILGDGH